MFFRFKAIEYRANSGKRDSYILDGNILTRFSDHKGGICFCQDIIQIVNEKDLNSVEKQVSIREPPVSSTVFKYLKHTVVGKRKIIQYWTSRRIGEVNGVNNSILRIMVNKLELYYKNFTENARRAGTRQRPDCLYLPLPISLLNEKRCCYANAAMQILTAITPIMNIIFTCKCEYCNPDLDNDSFLETTVTWLQRVMTHMKYGRSEQYSLRQFTDYMGFSEGGGDQDLPDDQDYHSFVASMLERDVMNDKYETTAMTLRIGLCHDIK